MICDVGRLGLRTPIVSRIEKLLETAFKYDNQCSRNENKPKMTDFRGFSVITAVNDHFSEFFFKITVEYIPKMLCAKFQVSSSIFTIKRRLYKF